MKCKNLYTDVIIFASSVCVYVGIFKDIKEYTFIEGGEGKTSYTDFSNEQIFPLKGMLWEAAAPLGIGMRKLPVLSHGFFHSFVAQMCKPLPHHAPNSLNSS